MINVQRAGQSLSRLAILKFFPADETARTELLSFVCEMAHTNEQVEWLVTRARQLWNEWQGPRELRAIFCSKFRPADGIEAYSDLEKFADGIPSEVAERNVHIAARPQLAIAGEESGSESISATIRDLAVAKDLNRALKRIAPPKVAEIPVLQITPQNRITQADIDREVEALRNLRAQEEIG